MGCFAMALFFNAVGGNNQILIVRDLVEEITVHFLFPICWCQQEGSMDLKGINKPVIKKKCYFFQPLMQA